MKIGEGARFSLSAEKAYGSSGFPAWGYPFTAPYCITIQVVAVWLFAFYPLPHVIVCVFFLSIQHKDRVWLTLCSLPSGG